jgi:hypothetical protein
MRLKLMSCGDLELIFQFPGRVKFANKVTDITITILYIIHRPVLYLKQDVSETRFCLRLQAEPTQLGQIDRTSLSLSLRTPATK